MKPTTNSKDLYQAGNDHSRTSQGGNGYYYLLHKINELSASVNETKQDIQQINDRLDIDEANIEMLQTMFTNLNNKLDGFGTQLNNLEETVSHIIVSVPEYEIYNNEIKAIRPTTDDNWHLLYANHASADKESNVIDLTYLKNNDYQVDKTEMNNKINELSGSALENDDYITPEQLNNIINGG